jgi:hypothetical protein
LGGFGGGAGAPCDLAQLVDVDRVAMAAVVEARAPWPAGGVAWPRGEQRRREVCHAQLACLEVNPRIYRGIWSHYEQLVDELPRDRRRGALTALINAVLAQHAPRDVAEARAAITWLRQAEARGTGS